MNFWDPWICIQSDILSCLFAGNTNQSFSDTSTCTGSLASLRIVRTVLIFLPGANSTCVRLGVMVSAAPGLARAATTPITGIQFRASIMRLFGRLPVPPLFLKGNKGGREAPFLLRERFQDQLG